MKKIFLYSFAALAICGFIAGCGNKSDNAIPKNLVSEKVIEAVLLGIPTQQKPLEYEPCSLNFSWWGEASRNEATLQAIAAFEEKYPGIEIQPTYGEWDEWEASMKEQLADGQAPDISQVSWNWLHTYNKDNSPFSDLYAVSDILGFDQIKQKYLDQCIVEDELLGIPISMMGRVFFFNKTSFEEAGIEVPHNMENLIKAGEIFKVRLGEDYYPLALNEYDRMIFMIYYLQSLYGKEWVVDSELQYSVEEITQGMEFLRTLEESHVIPAIPELDAESQEDLSQSNGWITGKYGGTFSWDTSVIKFRNNLEEGQEMVIEDLFDESAPYKGGFTKVAMVFSIGEQCANKREAAIFLNFMLNEEDGVRNLEATRGIPVSKEGLELCLEEKILDEQTVEANQKMLNGRNYSMDPKFETASNGKDMYSIYQDIMSSLSYGDYNPEEAARMLMQEIDTAYKE